MLVVSNDKYVGRILDNRYEILELIGAGGMALVYKARCHRLNRLVAIKILKEDLAGDQEFQRRFYTESQAVAMLSHPNIVAVYDVSRSGSTEYIVMELIEGITLKQYINRKGLLNWKEALHFATQITKALGHAHSRGIIHRDIKPHNIMILKDGSVKVADFGIARLLTVENTLTQEALGSVHYISPEQAKGAQVDARSDLYSLGVVMYEMLTSRLPFVGESAVSVAIQHISAIPLMPREINPDIPVGLEDITMHAMEPDLNVRFTTADEMLYSLEEFRKNPAIVFRYAKTDPNAAASQTYEEFDTRIVPRGTQAAIPQPRVEANGAAPKQAGQQAPVAERRPKPPAPAQPKTLKKPEMTEDDFRVAKTRASNTATLVGVLGVLVVLIVLALIIWGIVGEWFNQPEIVIIDNFVNQRLEDIISDDQYDGIYSFTSRGEYNAQVPEGVVISQNPAAHREMSFPLSGDPIRISLVYSLGSAPPDTMPDGLIGLHYSSARSILTRKNMNLTIMEDVEDSEDIDVGYVIRTIPAAGEVLYRNDTVLIIISGGREIIYETVPDMIGRTIDELEIEFEDLGFTADVRYEVNDLPEGTVLFIQRMDDSIAVPATLIVRVSSGPEIRYVTVPNLVGHQLSALLEAFDPLELTAEIHYYEHSSIEGTVLFIQSAGEEIAVPATLIVQVSTGEPDYVDPTPDPSPSEDGGDGGDGGDDGGDGGEEGGGSSEP